VQALRGKAPEQLVREVQQLPGSWVAGALLVQGRLRLLQGGVQGAVLAGLLFQAASCHIHLGGGGPPLCGGASNACASPARL
jgi:hypothetical protein